MKGNLSTGVDLFIVDATWPQAAIAAAYCRLLPEEKQRIDRMCEAGKAQLTISLFVRRPLLAAVTGLPESEHLFSRNKQGKQTLCGQSDWHFNVADTAGCVVFAVAKGQAIGVDAEAHDRSIVNLDDFITVCLSPAGQQQVRQLPPVEKKARVLKAWVLKEAYTKRLGVGLSFGFQRITAEPDSQPPQLIVDKGAEGSSGYLSLWADYLDHYIALSVEGEVTNLTIKLLQAADFAALL